MVLAVTAVTRTGTQEGLGTEEGTARGAPWGLRAALAPCRDTGQMGSAPARQRRLAAAEGLLPWVRYPWLTQQPILPKAGPAGKALESRSICGPAACGCQKALTACGKIQLCSRHGCYGLCGTGNSLASLLHSNSNCRAACCSSAPLLHHPELRSNLLTCFFS